MRRVMVMKMVWIMLVLSGPYGGRHYSGQKVQVCVCVPPARAGGLRDFSRYIILYGSKSFPTVERSHV